MRILTTLNTDGFENDIRTSLRERHKRYTQIKCLYFSVRLRNWSLVNFDTDF